MRDFRFIIGFSLTLILGLVIFAPYRDCQPSFEMGDHGRDLYVFQKISEGRTLYRDVDWYYGPLMPYYYAAWMRLAGSSITTVLLAEAAVKIACGILFFLIFAALWGLTAEGVLAAAGLWIFMRWFGHTYNHVAGIFFLLTVFACLLAFAKTSRPVWVWLAALAVFLATLVKFNLGAAAAAASVASLLLWWRYFAPTPKPAGLPKLLWPIIVALSIGGLAYLLLLHSETQGRLHVIMEGKTEYLSRLIKFTEYLKEPGGRQYLAHAWWPDYLKPSKENIFWPVFFPMAGIWASLVFWRRAPGFQKKQILFAVLCAGCFAVLLSHEAVLQALYSHKIAWVFPFIIFLCVGAVFFAASTLGRRRFLIYGMMAIFYGLAVAKDYTVCAAFKTPGHFLHLPRGNVYVPKGGLYTEICIDLLGRLKEGEPFLVIPYGPLFYYLTGHDAPTSRYLFRLDDAMSLDEEGRFVRTLEERKIRLVLISNFAFLIRGSDGWFGQTHYRLLAAYIKQNFSPDHIIGKWSGPSRKTGYPEDYAVVVCQRR